jgi:hypothetical protein
MQHNVKASLLRKPSQLGVIRQTQVNLIEKLKYPIINSILKVLD